MNSKVIKILYSIFGVVVVLLGAGAGFGKVMGKQETILVRVAKVETKADNNENDNIRQTVIQERTVKILDELEKRVYKK